MTKAALEDDKGQGLAPFSLKNAPSFIEAQFPVGRLSAEAYKGRKANLGQTLTGLGSYWKGRKPLILARAVVLGALLPATDNPAKDLEVFLKLMAMDDAAFGRRFDGGAAEFVRLFPAYADPRDGRSQAPQGMARQSRSNDARSSYRGSFRKPALC
jgi:adenine-specific DNA methylase